MRPQLRNIVALVGAAALAAPPAAMAQGAADEQYRDPFAGQGQEPAEQQAPTSQGSAPSAPSAPTAEPAPAAETPVAGTTAQLPRTGLPAAIVAVAGFVLVAAGLTLRRRLR